MNVRQIGIVVLVAAIAILLVVIVFYSFLPPRSVDAVVPSTSNTPERTLQGVPEEPRPGEPAR